jgi:tetratricopeptide (TPR) repeat protein
LRANLRSIASSISVHDRSYEEIEDFVTGESDDELSRMIASEALVNADLANEIGLFSEINESIVEEDVMKLRAGLKQIMGSETSHTRSIEDIDEYFNGNLSEEAVASFEDELMMNPGLAAELSLNIGINDAIGEKDIMSLRERLQSISKEERESGTEKRGFTTRRKQIIWYAAASVILLIAISGILRNRTYTDQQIYSEFYQPYNGIANTSRSASSDEGTLMGEAISRMNRDDNESALNIMEGILAKDQDNYTCNFYSGLIYQEKGEYSKAVNSFEKVVFHGDNLFVEQSEWYMGLCYISNDERDKAIRQFRKIAATGGYYQERSKSILKRFE